MHERRRLFVLLWLAGFTGVFSFLWVDLTVLLAALPDVATAEMPMSPAMIKLASLVQGSLLLAVAVLAGVALAPKVGLHAPVAEALARGAPAWGALRPQLVPGVLGGIAGGLLLPAILWACTPYLSERFLSVGAAFTGAIPLPTRLLYGGITEELLLRWGVMSFLVWVLWLIVQKGQGAPRRACVVIPIVAAAVLFGIGHLPVAALLNQGLTPALVVYVVSANAAFGLIAGWLFWRKGLESAMLAHMVVHVVMFCLL